MGNSKRLFIRFRNYITAVICSAGIAACIGFLLYHTGIYLQGSAIYAQLYKLDEVMDSMQQGTLFPLYARHWYNGYEIFRYSPPAAYLCIGMISRMFRADIHTSICIFYGITAFVAQMGFFLFGIRQKKMAAAFLTGTAFFFLPSTVSTAVLQGSFDIVMCMGMLPVLLFFVYDFVRWKNRLAMLPFSILFCLFTLTNYIMAIAFGLVLLLSLFLYALAVKSWKFTMAAAGNLLLLYAVTGYFLYPALSGGLLTRSYSLQGNWELPTGISFLVITVLGLLTANRTRMAGFLLTMTGILLSLPFAEPVMKLVPSVVLQKTYWYLLILTVILMVTLLCWERLRFVFLLLMLGAMVGENVPAMTALRDGTAVLEQDREMVEEYLLEEAASCTDNRLALMDQTTLGAFPHWYFTRQGIDTMYGWDFENALTVWNQMYLNEAFADGFYDYMFDRLLLYGNDVAVVLKELLPEEGSYNTLLAAASRNGYTVRTENDHAVVFKAEAVTGSYGILTRYKNLAIGDNASYIAYIYPSFGYGRSNCLEDYTVEELQRYHKLYLSGFTYREKEKAENMLKELSRKGTEIYIDMQHIPVNALTGKNEFMGTYAQYVQFTEDFPVLQNDNGNQFKLDFKAGGYGVWDTVYVSGCEEVLKETVYDNKSHLTYLGRNNDPNVTFMGFNLVYYYLITHNQDLYRFINEAMGLSSEDLHQPVIVPVTVDREPSQITVHTQEDGVNCNIACVDTLQPDRIVSTQENLWVVNQGDTVFRIAGTGRTEGIILTVLGCIAMGILWISIYVLLDKDGETN